MLLFWTIFFSTTALYIELTRPPKLINRVFSIIPILLLFTMVTFNRMSNDYYGYQLIFMNQGDGQIEIGYTYLIKFLTYFGQNHNAIIFIAGSLLIFTILKILKSSKYIVLVIFLYCLFPLVMDINQTRNLIMSLIVILSLAFVEKKKPIRYYLGVLLAFSIHRIALMYIPFYYLCKNNRKQFFKMFWKLLIIVSIASPLFISFFTRLFPAKMDFYLANRPTLGVLTVVSYTIIDIFTVWWVDKKINNKLGKEENEKMEVLYRFVWFSALALPFIFYTIEFNRVQRNVLLVKYIYCALAMKHLTLKQNLFTFILLLISVALPLLLLQYTDQLYLFDYIDINPIKDYLYNLF